MHIHNETLTPPQIDCPRATDRLRIGLPSTVATSHPATQASSSNLYASTPSVAPSHPPPAPSQSIHLTIAATENFITFLDALKLGMSSKDQLHPLLTEVITSVNKVTETDFEGRGSIIKWLIKLNGMKAHEELGESEKREVEFDLEGAYRGFKGAMS